MRTYPIPDPVWVKLHQEDSVDDVCGLLNKVSNDIEYRSLFLECDERELYKKYGESLDRTFAVLLAFLDEQWNEMANPLLALEDLVTDFRCSRAIWAGDKLLPPMVAGIGSIPLDDSHVFGRANSAIRDLVRNTLGALEEAGLLFAKQFRGHKA